MDDLDKLKIRNLEENSDYTLCHIFITPISAKGLETVFHLSEQVQEMGEIASSDDTSMEINDL